MIPITLIIGANILFDFKDISIVNHYSPLRTSIFSGLYIVSLMSLQSRMLKCKVCLGGFYTQIGIMLGFYLVKGPIIAFWTNHQLKQKCLKNPLPKEINEEVELNSIRN